MSAFQEYLTVRERNRAFFSDRYPEVHEAFEISVAAFDQLGEQLRVGRDASGRTHVSLAPLFFIFQRQSMAAYDALASNQAFLAWGLIRPGIEAALMIGKWADDKANADVWSNREENMKAYRALYQGAGLESAALPRSKEIRKALSRINDLFLHPNPTYYYRHLELIDLEDGAVKMSMNFFDEPLDVAVGVLGVLHLVAFVQVAVAKVFSTLFQMAQIDVGLRSLEAMAGDWARETMRAGPGFKTLLVELGLWPDIAASDE